MGNISKAEKVFKIIINVLLTLLILLIFAVGGIFVFDKISDAQEWDKLAQAGYVNQVSVGSHNINVCIRGNKDADYTVVSMAGLNNMANVVDMEPVTDQLTDKYLFAFVDRSGYGLSDDTHEEQTVEQIISDYRTALENAKVTKPYVLMAHSLGGVYASYWQQKYPDEIKAVIYLDPTQIGSLEDGKEEMQARHADFTMNMEVVACKIGLDRVIFNPAEYVVGLQTQQQKEHAELIWHRCPMSWTVCSEENNYYDNICKTANSLAPNDIPKLYIDAGVYTVEDAREKVAYQKKIAEMAGTDTTDIVMMEEDIDERLAEAMKEFYERNIQTYIDQLGNVTYVNIPGDHSIFKHKPDEVSKTIGNYLSTLK